MGLLTRNRPTELSPFDQMREELEHALKRIWNGDLEMAPPADGKRWLPSVDLSETEKEMEVKIDLPGMKPDDVEISVDENMLTIKGERTDEKKEEEQHFHRVERRHGSFLRRIPLPNSADTENIVANADHGVVTVTVPKFAQAAKKRVTVKPK